MNGVDEFTLTEAKKHINGIVDTLKPFESVETEADGTGKVGHFRVKRSQLIVVRTPEEAKKRFDKIVDSIQPFERVEVVTESDGNGKVDEILIKRTQSILIKGITTSPKI